MLLLPGEVRKILAIFVYVCFFSIVMCYIDDDMYVVILHASIPEPESKPFWDTPAVESQRIYRTSG